MLPSEIHHQICQVYGDNAMSDGVVRIWVRMFNEGRGTVHDEARSGCPSLVLDDLVRKVNERVHDDRRFTISDLSLHAQFSCPGDLASWTGDSWFLACLSSALDGVKGQIFTLQPALSPFPGKEPPAPCEWKSGLGLISGMDALEKSKVSCARCESNRSSSVMQPVAWSLYGLWCSCYPFHEARKR